MAKAFNPGGQKGKLHRELGIPVDRPIPRARLEKAMHSKNREVRDDAIRANTMEHWNHRHAVAHVETHGSEHEVGLVHAALRHRKR
jgi:hypothetical protein